MESKLFSHTYKEALDLVAVLFKDVTRADGKIPYVVHLVGVSHIVAQATDSEDAIIAALLHDVIEDIPADIYNEAQMRQDFGDRVTDIVKTVSHDQPKHGKDKAIQLYLEQIQAGSIDACIVCAADLLHNSIDMIQLYKDMPEVMKARFGGEKVPGRLQFWTERLRILEQRLGSDNVIIKELMPIWQQLAAIHQEIM